MRVILVFIIGVLFLLPYQIQAQHTVLDLFRSKLSIADHLYKSNDIFGAIKVYKSILGKSENDTYIKLQLARATKKINQREESRRLYSEIKDSSLFTAEDKLNLADLMLSHDNLLEAEFWLKEYTKEAPADTRGKNKLHVIHNKEVYFTDSLSFRIDSLPFNSEASEFFPYVFEKDILFLSDRPSFSFIKNYSDNESNHFFQIYKSHSQNSNVELFSKSLSSPYHEGPFCFFEDGKKIIFTRSNRKNKKLMLYMAEKKKGEKDWINISGLSFNNKDYSVSHPFYNEADSCLYFVSDMPGGYGGTDIYKSSLKNGKFSKPENIGPLVNTEGNEFFPFISKNTLYFTSDGHSGLGGMDIILAKKTKGEWSQLENPGYPLNSTADDFSIFMKEDGTGFFSSNRQGGKGKDDIYAVNHITEKIELKLKEKFNSEGISNVHITIKEGDKVVREDSSDAKGNVNYLLKPGKHYTLSFSRKGYKSKDTVIVTSELPQNPVYLEIPLDRRNKSYIKGIIWSPEETRLSNANVKIINKSSGLIENITANEEGEFFSQIDPDYIYLLSVESDTLSGYARVYNHPKKRGASVSVYDIFTGSTIMLTSTIKVLDSLTSQPISGSFVEINNITTGEQTYVTTDENGECTIETSILFEYEIKAKCNDYPSKPEKVVLEKRNYILILN